MIDSFTLSGYISHWSPRGFPGQIVDAGPLAPVGHGIGMAIGAQLARPGKQVVTVIGDGGIGHRRLGPGDRAPSYNLPIVAVLWNNSSWGPSFEQMPMLKGRTDPFDMLPEHPLRPDRSRSWAATASTSSSPTRSSRRSSAPCRRASRP